MTSGDDTRGVTSSLAMGAVLVAALVATWAARLAPPAWAPWLGVACSNGALLVGTWLLTRRPDTSFPLLGGGVRRLVGLVVALTTTAAMLLVVLAVPTEGRAGGSSPAMALVLVSVVPVAEEWFFRGLLLRHLDDLGGPVIATAATSLLFGFLHLPGGTMLPMVIFSALSCTMTLVTRSALWAVVLHVAWNTAATARLEAAWSDRALILAVGMMIAAALAARGMTSKERAHG